MSKMMVNVVREGYGPDQVSTTTIKELLNELEAHDDDAPIVLSFDRGYTYGGLRRQQFEEEINEETGEVIGVMVFVSNESYGDDVDTMTVAELAEFLENSDFSPRSKIWFALPYYGGNHMYGAFDRYSIYDQDDEEEDEDWI